MSTIKQSNLSFLSNLEKNNNRDWFKENKTVYEKEREDIISFAENVLKKMNSHDHIENENGKKCLHRIYRDVRFSKNKLPYKTNWSMSFKRATKLLRGGYYVHIENGKSFLGCGFWGPNPEDLKRMRTHISMFGGELTKILKDKKFIQNFGKLEGAQLKNGPKGFDKEDKFIDLLKYKQYLISKSFTDEEVLQKDFAKTVNESFKLMRPFLNFMSDALTTNENGELIV